MADTTAIDKLFLELSQFTKAKTESELALRRHVDYLNETLRSICDHADQLPNAQVISSLARDALHVKVISSLARDAPTLADRAEAGK